MSLHINPEYAKLLPQMSGEEYDALKNSIRDEGQHYAIIVNEDMEILDGHHRFRACVDLGLEPDFEVRKFDDKLLEKKFVIEANLRRRHLTNFQLVELGVPLLEIEKELAKKRKIEGGKTGRNLQLGFVPDDAKPVSRGKATEAVAKKVGVSTRTFERGKKILEKASEEDKQMLREGKTSISKVYSELVMPDRTGKLESPSDTAAQMLVDDSRSEENRTALSDVMKNLLDKKMFCPVCGNQMFECSKCHRSVEEMLEAGAKEKPT
jgi:ParB-like chromosome segregation protein Spo0J